MQNNDITRRPLTRVGFSRQLVDSSGVSFAGGAKIASLLAYAVLLIGGASGAARAQDTSVGATASRESLAQRVATDESEIARGNLKASRKKELELEIATIKDRLDNGDFHTGDLIVVTVTIPNLNPPKTTVDTSTVRANNFISITELPDLSVKGVLKSEIQDKVTALAEKYIKEPKVRVNFTTRVMVLGGVARPGTYNISPDRQLTELVTTAGGGTPTAKLDQLEVKRGAKVILSLNDSKKALVSGKTLEQVGIQPGDEVTVPQKRTFNWQVIVQFALLISSLTFAAVQFLQFYYSE